MLPESIAAEIGGGSTVNLTSPNASGAQIELNMKQLFLSLVLLAAGNTAFATSLSPVDVSVRDIFSVGEKTKSTSVVVPRGGADMRAAAKVAPVAEAPGHTVTFKSDLTLPNCEIGSVNFYPADMDIDAMGRIYASMEQVSPIEYVYHDVPEGTYDVLVTWTETPEHELSSPLYGIFRQEFKVDGDTDFTFSKSEACHTVTFDFKLPDGSKPVWPSAVDDGNGNLTRDWEGANVGQTYATCVFGHKRMSGVRVVTNTFNCSHDGSVVDAFNPAKMMQMVVNEFPDDWFFVCHVIFDAEDGNLYSSMNSTPAVHGDVTVATGSAGYIVHDDDFVNTPFASGVKRELYTREFSVNTMVCGLNAIGVTVRDTHDLTHTLHVNSANFGDGDKILAETMTEYLNYDYCENKQSGWMAQLLTDGVRSPLSLYRDGKRVYCNTGWNDFTYHYLYQAPEGGFWNYPGFIQLTNVHPVFSYPTGLRGGKIGDNVPVNSVLTLLLEDENNQVTIGYPALKGRYGESRLVDMQTFSVGVSVNGNTIYDNADITTYLDYMSSRYNAEKGVVKIIMTDTNIEVDGIAGINVTEFSYDERNDDRQAPTLQMLHFRDVRSNMVTDRFNRPEDGVMEFAGGDFIQHIGLYDYYYNTEVAADWKVEYAPMGDDNFTELKVTEIPELYFMPGFGHFYRVSLESVNRKSDNGWYDLRITSTDKAGNYQRQLLSPAFNVNLKNGDIDTTVADQDMQVAVSGNYIIAPEDAEIYNVNGIRVTGRSVAPGIYIVRTASKAMRIAVR